MGERGTYGPSHGGKGGPGGGGGGWEVHLLQPVGGLSGLLSRLPCCCVAVYLAAMPTRGAPQTEGVDGCRPLEPRFDRRSCWGFRSPLPPLCKAPAPLQMKWNRMRWGTGKRERISWWVGCGTAAGPGGAEAQGGSGGGGGGGDREHSTHPEGRSRGREGRGGWAPPPSWPPTQTRPALQPHRPWLRGRRRRWLLRARQQQRPPQHRPTLLQPWRRPPRGSSGVSQNRLSGA